MLGRHANLEYNRTKASILADVGWLVVLGLTAL